MTLAVDQQTTADANPYGGIPKIHFSKDKATEIEIRYCVFAVQLNIAKIHYKKMDC